MVSGLLATLTPGQFENSRDRNITVPTRTEALQFKGLDYLQCFALPNMYFHVATAYGLLRHNGVVPGQARLLGANAGLKRLALAQRLEPLQPRKYSP